MKTQQQLVVIGLGRFGSSLALQLMDMGIRVAHQLVTPNLLDYLELSKEYSIMELNVPYSDCTNGYGSAKSGRYHGHHRLQ